MIRLRGSLLIAPPAERFVSRRFVPARLFSFNSRVPETETPEQAAKRQAEEAAREKQRVEGTRNWISIVEEAARIKITRTPELMEEHSKIAVEYSKRMQRLSNSQNYDLSTKGYLKKEAIAALPPALRAHAEQKVTWNKRNARGILNAMFDKLPVWHTPPIENRSLIVKNMLNEDRMDMERDQPQLPRHKKRGKKLEKMTDAKRRALRKARMKAAREIAQKRKAKAKEAPKKK